MQLATSSGRQLRHAALGRKLALEPGHTVTRKELSAAWDAGKVQSPATHMQLLRDTKTEERT
jgi:hypothetical protein